MIKFKFYTVSLILLLLFNYTADAELITGRPPSFSPVDQVNFIVGEGSRISLKCPVFDDKVGLEWYKDNQPVNRHTPSLIIPTVARIDSGLYRCYAHNGIGGAFSPSYSVTVSYLDGFVEESDSFYEVKMSRQSGFVVLRPPELMGKGLVDVDWKWFNDNQEIRSDHNLFISKDGELVILDSSNSTGHYRVEASTYKSRAYSKDYTLQLQDEDAFPMQQQTLAIVYQPRDVKVAVVKHHQPVQATFECVPKLWNTSKDVKIHWFLNNDRLGQDTGLRFEQAGRRLIIQDVVAVAGKALHSSVVKCEVKTTDGLFQEHAEAKLDVEEAPRIEKESLWEDISKNLGDKVKLVCKEDIGWPRSRFTWYFNNQKLPSTSNIVRIESIQQKDFGVYQCEAKNIVGSDIAHIWLRTDDRNPLTRSVSILEAPMDVVAKVRDDVTLTCKSNDPDHTSTSWQFNGTELNRVPQYILNASSLTIKSVTKLDAGKYLCSVKSDANGHKIASAFAKVSVIDTKLIENGPVNQSLLIGSNVQMPCKMTEDYANRKDVQLTWFRNNHEIPETGDIQRRISIATDGSLWINQVGPDNIGVYKCRVVVKTFSSSSAPEIEEVTAWLKIIEKPSMPQAVRVELLNETLPVKISFVSASCK